MLNKDEFVRRVLDDQRRRRQREAQRRADWYAYQSDKGVQADAGQILEELRRIRGLLEIMVQEVAKESYTHF